LKAHSIRRLEDAKLLPVGGSGSVTALRKGTWEGWVSWIRWR
jgi:hypothetical protein